MSEFTTSGTPIASHPNLPSRVKGPTSALISRIRSTTGAATRPATPASRCSSTSRTTAPGLWSGCVAPLQGYERYSTELAATVDVYDLHATLVWRSRTSIPSRPRRTAVSGASRPIAGYFRTARCGAWRRSSQALARSRSRRSMSSPRSSPVTSPEAMTRCFSIPPRQGTRSGCWRSPALGAATLRSTRLEQAVSVRSPGLTVSVGNTRMPSRRWPTRA